MFSIVPDGSEFSFFSSVSVVSVMPSKLVKTDVESVRLPLMHRGPDAVVHSRIPSGRRLAKFKSIGEVVILAAKQTPIGTYVQGLLLEDLLKWTLPKKAGEVVTEDGLLTARGSCRTRTWSRRGGVQERFRDAG